MGLILVNGKLSPSAGRFTRSTVTALITGAEFPDIKGGRIVGLDMSDGGTSISAETGLFLSYNRQDQEAVQSICQRLKLRGIPTFLDRDRLGAGLPWPQALEQALTSSRAVAIFLGPHDFGLWQKREMFFALR